jgi:NADH-quinone oxidoreductase E subunit
MSAVRSQEGLSDATTPSAIDFPALLERLRPELEAIIAQYEEPRSALLPMMHRFQEEEGFVSREAMWTAAEMLGLTPAVVESVVSFYTLFFRKPVGKYMLQVCRGLSCVIKDAEEIMAYFRKQLGIGHLETTDDGLFSYEEVECLAACHRATCMQVNLEFVYDLTPKLIDEMLAAMRAGTYPVKPLAQTRKPERTWKVPKDVRGKSAGAQGVLDPNDPGGVGDRSGVIMLERFAQERWLEGRSRERLVKDAAAWLATNANEEKEGR